MTVSKKLWMSEQTLAGDKAGIDSELVDLLYGSSFNIVFISLATSAFCAVIASRNNDTGFLILALSALVVGALRYANNLAYHGRKIQGSTKDWRRRHELASLLYAVVMSAIGAYPFAGGPVEGQVFSVALLISYCAGAINRLAVHPRLAICCTSLASLPAVVVLLLPNSTILEKLLGLLIFAMQFAGIQIIRGAYTITRDMLISRAELAALAGNDSLTGLANRFSLDIRLRRILLDLETKSDQAVAVHFIDLDHFKAANDTFGHRAGDAILMEVGERLRKLMPVDAFAARNGGDEFVVVQHGLTSKEAAAQLSHAIQIELSAPYIISDQPIIIGATVGVAISSDPSIPPQSLIVNADRALYEAKRKGRGTVEFHSPALDDAA
jgi:diguanylate cyclase